MAVAYTPDGGFLGKLTGAGGVIRAGGGLVYDRFGSDLVTQFDSTASFGLSEHRQLGAVGELHRRASATTARCRRSAGARRTRFPFTPPEVNFIGGNYMGIDTDAARAVLVQRQRVGGARDARRA